MKTYVFPADTTGCGCYRLIWPAEQLKRDGYNVEVVLPSEREKMLQGIMNNDKLVNVRMPSDADVIVFQRVTHRLIADAITIIRKKGIAVVVDMDDDLSCIHPANPAFNALHPKMKQGQMADHSWENVQRACDNATLVTVSTPALLQRYARHERGVVLYNHVPQRMIEIPHTDSAAIGWGGSVHSHPDDLPVVGSSVAQLLRRGHEFRVAGSGEGVRAELNIPEDAMFNVTGVTDIDKWGEALTTIGIGIAPLADTKFNAAKSWLKPLEMCAVGVPWVASPRVEYQRLHNLGVGLLAKNSTAWLRHLRALTQSADMRQEYAAKGRLVAAEWTIEDNAWKWWAAWSSSLTLL